MRPNKFPKHKEIRRPCKCFRHEMRQGKSGISEQGGYLEAKSIVIFDKVHARFPPSGS
jgi:hypothetical protein